MTINIMRKLDYWFGIPLCFISSLWFKLLHLFLKVDNTSSQKTLIIGLSEMGSMVLAQACIQKLANNSSLYFITFKQNKPALELLGLIPDNNIFTLDTSNIFIFIRNTLQFFIWARKNKISIVVDLELFSRFSALLGAYSGAKKYIGFYAYHTEGLYRGDFFTHPVAYNPHKHISINFMSLAYAAEIESIDKAERPLLKQLISKDEVSISKTIISDIEIEQIKKIICQNYPDCKNQDIILINSEGGDLLPMRNWGQENFYHLIKLILNQAEQDNTNILILLTGSSAEYPAIEKLKQKINNPLCINFAGAVSLKKLLTLYSISNYMVTNDSGPNHFASLTSMQTITLFGPETPKLYGSLGTSTNIYKGLACSPCVSAFNQRKTACSNNICMQQISPEEVFQIINTIEK